MFQGFDGISKLLISLGMFIVIIGILFGLLSRFGFGRLPGDILIKRGNITFYFPVLSMIVISVLLSVILNFFRR
jgi:uncharacterized membrane protein (DUF106 family)